MAMFHIEAWWLSRGSVGGKKICIERGTVVIHNGLENNKKKQTWLTFCVMTKKRKKKRASSEVPHTSENCSPPTLG
jgi:hypothetical protein